MNRTTCLALLLFLAVPGWLAADDDALRDLGTNAAPGEIAKWDGAQWRNAHDNITTVNPGPGLSGGMTNGSITVGVTFGGQRTNNLVAAYTEMDATRPPVGAIVAWAKNLTGVSTNLPANWVECNGQMLNDSSSPLHGTSLPALNGSSDTAKRFLRGAATSGLVGGTVSHDHGSVTVDRWDNLNQSVGGSGGATHLPPYYDVVWIMRVK